MREYMKIAFMIYLLSIVDKILWAASMIAVVSLIGTAVAALAFLIASTDGYTEETTIGKIKVIPIKIVKLALIPSFLIGILIPNSKTLAAMYLIPKITANESVQKIPDKLLTITNKKLDEWISDFSKEEGGK